MMIKASDSYFPSLMHIYNSAPFPLRTTLYVFSFVEHLTVNWLLAVCVALKTFWVRLVEKLSKGFGEDLSLHRLLTAASCLSQKAFLCERGLL